MKVVLVIFAILMCAVCFGNAASTKETFANYKTRVVSFGILSFAFFASAVGIWAVL